MRVQSKRTPDEINRWSSELDDQWLIALGVGQMPTIRRPWSILNQKSWRGDPFMVRCRGLNRLNLRGGNIRKIHLGIVPRVKRQRLARIIGARFLMLTRFDYDLTLASTSVLQEPTSAKGRSKKDG
jgi:hypothetical protein